MSAMWCWRRRAAGTAPAGRATACPPASPSIPGRKACTISTRNPGRNSNFSQNSKAGRKTGLFSCRRTVADCRPISTGGTMKTALLTAALLISTPLAVLAQEATHPTKLYASSANVQALVAKAKAEHKTGNTVELVVNDEGYPFQLEYRTDTTPPSIHPKHAELIEVIEGSCTLITGGKL